jgi:uncharacterized protein (TIGR04255 family)
MSQPHHLRFAPISEAIIDFRVKSRPDFRVQAFSDLKQVFADRFPKVEERHISEFRLSTSRAASPIVESQNNLQGYFFKSSDERLIAQFRVDGFTLNRLEPYTNWQELYTIAIELWQQYCKVASPETVTRIALRYINRIPLLSDQGRLDDYLRAAPSIPPELPQSISAFFSRITIHDDERHLAAHITQALEAVPATQKSVLILDIDAFREVDIPPHDQEVMVILGQLRDFKNLIFFNYLTDETVRSFE